MPVQAPTTSAMSVADTSSLTIGVVCFSTSAAAARSASSSGIWP